MSPRRRNPAMPLFSGGGGGGINGMGNSGGGGGGGDDDVSGGGGGNDDKSKKKAAVLVLAEMGRSLESIPKDLAAAIESGKIPAAIVEKYFELEKSALFRWLLKFGGFRERLLADDLFLAKVAIECGVGMFTKVCLLLNLYFVFMNYFHLRLLIVTNFIKSFYFQIILCYSFPEMQSTLTKLYPPLLMNFLGILACYLFAISS